MPTDSSNSESSESSEGSESSMSESSESSENNDSSSDQSSASSDNGDSSNSDSSESESSCSSSESSDSSSDGSSSSSSDGIFFDEDDFELTNPDADDYESIDVDYINDTGLTVEKAEFDDTTTPKYSVASLTESVLTIKSLGPVAGLASASQTLKFTLQGDRIVTNTLTLGTKKTLRQGGKEAAESYAIEEFSGQIAVQMADLSASLGLDDSQQASIEALASQTLGIEDFKVTFKESMKAAIDLLKDDDNISVAFTSSAEVTYTLDLAIADVQMTGAISNTFTPTSSDTSSWSGGLTLKLKDVDTGIPAFNLLMDAAQFKVRFKSVSGSDSLDFGMDAVVGFYFKW